MILISDKNSPFACIRWAVPEKFEQFIQLFIYHLLFGTQENDNFLNITVKFYCILSGNKIFITIDPMIHSSCRCNAEDI